jgi:hypothetical protein
METVGSQWVLETIQYNAEPFENCGPKTIPGTVQYPKKNRFSTDKKYFLPSLKAQLKDELKGIGSRGCLSGNYFPGPELQGPTGR